MAQLPALRWLRSAGRLGRIAMLILVIAGLFVAVWLLAPARYRLVVESILALLILLLSCVLVFPKLIAPAHPAASLQGITEEKDRIQFQDDRLKLQNDVRAALLQAIGGAALLIGLLFTWQQFQTNRQQLSDQLKLSRQGQVAERFTRAIDQLGSGKLEIQLGGIYGLEQIARDSPDQRLVVFEVLTAYVRKHAPWPPRLPDQPAKDIPITQIPEMQVRAADVQAALTVLGHRNGHKGDPKLDLRAADLRNAQLDDTNLQDATLRESSLQGAHLQHARLQGADLSGAWLQSADLLGAQLQGASFTYAQLQDAFLTYAQLQGAFLSAQLQGADLSYTQLQHANLFGAQLQHADLSGAQLQGADLSHARLQDADLSGAQLQGAIATKDTQWPSSEYDWRAAGIKMSAGS